MAWLVPSPPKSRSCSDGTSTPLSLGFDGSRSAWSKGWQIRVFDECTPISVEGRDVKKVGWACSLAIQVPVPDPHSGDTEVPTVWSSRRGRSVSRWFGCLAIASDRASRATSRGEMVLVRVQVRVRRVRWVRMMLRSVKVAAVAVSGRQLPSCMRTPHFPTAGAVAARPRLPSRLGQVLPVKDRRGLAALPIQRRLDFRCRAQAGDPTLCCSQVFQEKKQKAKNSQKDGESCLKEASAPENVRELQAR